MKDTTFGDFPAAKTLVTILTQHDHKKLTAKIGCYWCRYCHGIRGIMDMPDKKLAYGLLILWKDDAVRRAKEHFYGEVQTYFVNIIVAKFRENKEQL